MNEKPYFIKFLMIEKHINFHSKPNYWWIFNYKMNLLFLKFWVS